MILTDEEITAAIGCTGIHPDITLDMRVCDCLDDARAVESAVLEKLKQQKPVAWNYELENDAFRRAYTLGFKADTPLYAAPMPADDVLKDAERYRLLRRAQHWSVIDGIGDELRAEVLDAAIDAAMEKTK